MVNKKEQSVAEMTPKIYLDTEYLAYEGMGFSNLYANGFVIRPVNLYVSNVDAIPLVLRVAKPSKKSDVFAVSAEGNKTLLGNRGYTRLFEGIRSFTAKGDSQLKNLRMRVNVPETDDFEGGIFSGHLNPDSYFKGEFVIDKFTNDERDTLTPEQLILPTIDATVHHKIGFTFFQNGARDFSNTFQTLFDAGRK